MDIMYKKNRVYRKTVIKNRQNVLKNKNTEKREKFRNDVCEKSKNTEKWF